MKGLGVWNGVWERTCFLQAGRTGKGWWLVNPALLLKSDPVFRSVRAPLGRLVFGTSMPGRWPAGRPVFDKGQPAGRPGSRVWPARMACFDEENGRRPVPGLTETGLGRSIVLRQV